MFLLALAVSNAAIADQRKYEECLLREIHSARYGMTVEDLKNACSASKLDTVEPISETLLEDEKKQQQIAAVDERLKCMTIFYMSSESVLPFQTGCRAIYQVPLHISIPVYS